MPSLLTLTVNHPEAPHEFNSTLRAILVEQARANRILMSTLTELKEVLAGLVPVVQTIAENQQRDRAEIARLTEELGAGNASQVEIDEAVVAAKAVADSLKAIVPSV